MRVTIAVAVLAAGISQAQGAGRPITSVTPDATRAELTARLDSLVRVDAQGGGKPAQVQERKTEVTALRTRLADGDFQTGERFLIDLGDPTHRADTVVVRDSGNIALLNWPSYSLHGVLRSELQPTVDRYVATYIRDPHIRVTALTRIVVVGGVGRPGVYNLESSQPFSDALAAAGGMGQSGKSDQISVYRSNSRILDEKRVNSAIRDGATIAELGLLSGDEIRVPVKSPRRNWLLTVQPIFLGVSVIAAILALIRASYAP